MLSIISSIKSLIIININVLIENVPASALNSNIEKKVVVHFERASRMLNF